MPGGGCCWFKNPEDSFMALKRSGLKPAFSPINRSDLTLADRAAAAELFKPPFTFGLLLLFGRLFGFTNGLWFNIGDSPAPNATGYASIRRFPKPKCCIMGEPSNPLRLPISGKESFMRPKFDPLPPLPLPKLPLPPMDGCCKTSIKDGLGPPEDEIRADMIAGSWKAKEEEGPVETGKVNEKLTRTNK